MIPLILATLFQTACVGIFWFLLRTKAQAEVEAQTTPPQRRMSDAIGLLLFLNVCTLVAHLQQLATTL